MNNFLENKKKLFRLIKSPELLNISIINKFNNNKEKIKSYIAYKGLEYLKEEIPYLLITDYSFQKSISKLESYIFVILKNKNILTHPFVVFANINTNEIYFLMSYGKDKKMGQYQLDLYEEILSEKWKYMITTAEYYAMYLLLADSIQTRKNDIITNDRYSLLKCSNITQCVVATRKIKKENRDKSTISNLIKEKELYYRKKAILALTKFFNLLDKAQFEEAFKYLKIEKIKKGHGRGRIIKKNSYFGKERLDTFFKNNRKLLGHLQIFIDLYQFIHLLVSRII
jgi:hypothetical protein